jgi:hypothetical protein
MKLPEIVNDGNRVNVTIGIVTLYFSYSTLIAFQVLGSKPVVRVNEWGPTTGKHMHEVDGGDKKTRVDAEYFQQLFNDRVGDRIKKVA